jgi:hypothetical protein
MPESIKKRNAIEIVHAQTQGVNASDENDDKVSYSY